MIVSVSGCRTYVDDQGDEGQINGWMDGEDLIICVAIWTLYKRRGPLTCDDLRALSIASQHELRLRPNVFRFFVDFGAPALPKWSQNRAQNPIFGYFFAILFSTTLLDRFFIDFSRTRPLKSSISLRKNNDFHYIDVFAKVQKRFDFDPISRGQNHEKSIKTRV